MILSIIAGIFNGIGTIYLKASNNKSSLVLVSLIFYALNFIFFRISLKHLEPKNSYIFLIMSSLVFLKMYEVFKGGFSFGIKDLLGIALFIASVYLLNPK